MKKLITFFNFIPLMGARRKKLDLQHVIVRGRVYASGCVIICYTHIIEVCHVGMLFYQLLVSVVINFTVLWVLLITYLPFMVNILET